MADTPEPQGELTAPAKPKKPAMNWFQSKITLGNTQFTFRKIPGMRAWAYFGEWRQEGLAKVLGAPLPDAPQSFDPLVDLGISLMKGLAVIDQNLVEKIRTTMFEYVDFYQPGLTKNVQPLAGLEDQAFAELGVAAVFEVFARALAVNFTDFLDFLDKTGLTADLSKKAENSPPNTIQP